MPSYCMFTLFTHQWGFPEAARLKLQHRGMNFITRGSFCVPGCPQWKKAFYWFSPRRNGGLKTCADLVCNLWVPPDDCLYQRKLFYCITFYQPTPILRLYNVYINIDQSLCNFMHALMLPLLCRCLLDKQRVHLLLFVASQRVNSPNNLSSYNVN